MSSSMLISLERNISKNSGFWILGFELGEKNGFH